MFTFLFKEMILSFFIAFIFWQTGKHLKKIKGAKSGVYMKNNTANLQINGLNDSNLLEYK